MDERMTGDPDGAPPDVLAGRLGTALRELVPDRSVTPGLVDRVQQGVNRRRRNRRDLLAGSSVLVCVLVAVTALVTLLPIRGNRFDATVATSSPPVASTAPDDDVDRSRPYQRVLPAELPPDGGEVALVLVNPTADPVVGGLQGRIDRWDGAGWRPYREYSAAASEWGWAGRAVELAQPLGTRSVGIGAAPRGFAEPVWLRLPPLPEGRYRFVEGAAADAGPAADRPAGVLVVRSGAPAPDGIRPQRAPFLVAGPVVAGRASPLVLHRAQGATATGLLQDQPGLRRATWSRNLRLERRGADGRWSDAGLLAVPPVQLQRLGAGEEATLGGLSLPPGTYRVTLQELGPADGLTGYGESGVLFVLPPP